MCDMWSEKTDGNSLIESWNKSHDLEEVESMLDGVEAGARKRVGRRAKSGGVE